MASFPDGFIIDSIHGDIHLLPAELKLIDTPSFQRLRYIKQLQMGHLTYPNATHTRFAHSIGTLGIMSKVIATAKEVLCLTPEEESHLRFAALLHDIGHYPYSHLMETVHKVTLLDQPEGTSGDRILSSTSVPQSYPHHAQLGEIIVNSQQEIIEVLGGVEEARKVSDVFTDSETANPKLSRLISSSLDFDRCDYLLRDAYATGLPYGHFDLNYLLNRLHINSQGTVGVQESAVPAVEHFLLARYFMYRNIYYHRTTVAFEEACRHLLRRLRDKGQIDDREKIIERVKSDKLVQFTDSFVDSAIYDASKNEDQTIKTLAKTILSRTPPKLLKEVLVLEGVNQKYHKGSIFMDHCKSNLKALADRHSINLGLFLLYTNTLSLEKHGGRFTGREYAELPPNERKDQLKKEMEIIQIYRPENLEKPVSLLDIDYSIIGKLRDQILRIYRLYFVAEKDNETLIDELKREIGSWADVTDSI